MAANVLNPSITVIGAVGVAPGAFPYSVLPKGPAGIDRATGFLAAAAGQITVRLKVPRADGTQSLVLDLADNNRGRAVEFTDIEAADPAVWPLEVEYLGHGHIAAPASSGAIAGTVDVEGTGAPGAPAGGVLSVQGVPGGTALPVNDAALNAKLPAVAVPSDAGANDPVTVVAVRLEGWTGSGWDLVRVGQSATTSAPTGFLNALPFAQHLAAPVALANGDCAPLLLDANHRLMTSSLVLNFPSTQDVEGVGTAGVPTGGVMTVQGASGGEPIPAVDRRLMPPSATLYRGTASSQFTIRGSAGTFWVLVVEGTTAGDLWLQLFDAAALPPNGTIADLEVQIPQAGLGTASLSLPHDFSNGIFAAVSSTPDMLTLTGAPAPAIIRAKHSAIGA
jgi:hypothetical protein